VALTWYFGYVIEYDALSVRSHISKTTRPNFTKFSMHVACGRGSVLIWRRFCVWRHVSVPRDQLARTTLCLEEVRQVAVPVGRRVVGRVHQNAAPGRNLPSTTDQLFNKTVSNSSHTLHSLLPLPPTASQHYNLRRRTHTHSLPKHDTHLCDCNFLTRMSYKDSY